MNNLRIDVNLLSKLSFEEVISLYKQGYTIDEKKTNQYGLKSLATCPSSIVQGTTKTLTITPNGGTPPYTKLELLVDGFSVKSLIGNYTGATSITYNFPESPGNHTYSSRTTDNCNPPKVAIDATPCTINITSATLNTICTWITSIGGWNVISVSNIMTLVSAFQNQTNLGFTVTVSHIMGGVAYFQKNVSSGNLMTGCTF